MSGLNLEVTKKPHETAKPKPKMIAVEEEAEEAVLPIINEVAVVEKKDKPKPKKRKKKEEKAKPKQGTKSDDSLKASLDDDQPLQIELDF